MGERTNYSKYPSSVYGQKEDFFLNAYTKNRVHKPNTKKRWWWAGERTRILHCWKLLKADDQGLTNLNPYSVLKWQHKKWAAKRSGVLKWYIKKPEAIHFIINRVRRPEVCYSSPFCPHFSEGLRQSTECRQTEQTFLWYNAIENMITSLIKSKYFK